MSVDSRGRVRAGMVEAWTRRVRLVEGGKVYRRDGLVLALTLLPDPSLNVTLVESDPADPEESVAAACALFDIWGREVGFDLERGAHPDLESALHDAGLRPLVTRPAMAIDLTDRSALPKPDPQMRYERVETPEQLEQFRSIEVEVFGTAPGIAERTLAEDILWADGLGCHLVSLPSAPAGAGVTTHRTGDTVGIFGVGTRELFRRRGMGRAATCHALATAAAEGAAMAWLQSTDMAVELYASLGFEQIADWTVWTIPSVDQRLSMAT